MPADTSSFVAGHYTATYDGDDIGTTEVGFEIRKSNYKEDIRIDDFGDTIVDGIYRGYNLRVQFQLSEWTAAGREKLQFIQDLDDAGTIGDMQFIGRTERYFSKALVLTPVADINVANLTYTFPNCIPEGDSGGWNLNTKLRRVTVTLLALVNRATGVVFTET